MLFTNYISRINNTQVDDSHDINVLMPMLNLIEDTDNYRKTSGILWQNYRDKPVINVTNGNIDHFDAANTTTDSFKNKEKMTCQTVYNGKKNVENDQNDLQLTVKLLLI